MYLLLAYMYMHVYGSKYNSHDSVNASKSQGNPVLYDWMESETPSIYLLSSVRYSIQITGANR